MPVTFSQIEVSIQVSAKMVTTHEESGSFGVGHTRNVVAPTSPAGHFEQLRRCHRCTICCDSGRLTDRRE